MMTVLKFLWIDDMDKWVSSALSNLNIVANKYDFELMVIQANSHEEIETQLTMRNINFDCVFMDYKMEPFTGDIYIDKIRNEKDFEHLWTVPIIFYSQDTDTNLEELVKSYINVYTVFRGNLEDKIKEMFFE